MSIPHWNRGVAGQITQNSNRAPTQRGGPFVSPGSITAPMEPIMGSTNMPEISPDVNHPMYGGHIHGEWGDLFDGGNFTPPTGRPSIIHMLPDVRAVHTTVTEPQNLVTGGSADPWHGFFQLVKGAMRNGRPTTY